ncbi:MAG: NucA/NucB deoxyribonuclease domain-containing protein, partial [Actinomycetota bacterium]|nr:NucA/NucB deoxyribonuclease domain-containing protein [Actinomycetota bacterium]
MWITRAAIGLAAIAGLIFIPGPAGAALTTGQFCSIDKQNHYKQNGFICKPGSDGRNRLHKYSGGGTGGNDGGGTTKPGPSTGPSTDPPGCSKPRKIVRIKLSRRKYPTVFRHLKIAVRKGFPRVTKIRRAGADQRRRKVLAGIPTKRGHDRDEWPMAMARKTWKAHVMYVPISENRSAGAKVGGTLRRYCDGTRFTLVRELSRRLRTSTPGRIRTCD